MVSSPVRAVTSVYRSPAFLRLWLARVLSKAGDNLTEVAVAVFAFRASNNNPLAYAGVLVLAQATPAIFGWLALGQLDRVHKKRLMVTMDLVRAALVVSIPLVGILWWALVAVFATQLCSTYYNPAIRAILPDTVEEDEIVRANAAIQNGMNAVDIPVYLVATALVLKIGTSVAFMGDGASFLLAGVAIATMQLPHHAWLPRAGQMAQSFWQDVQEGLRYIYQTPLVRWLLGCYMLAAVGTYALPVAVATLIHAGFKAPMAEMGPVFAAVALGALTGSLAMERWNPGPLRFRTLLSGGLLVFGASVVAMAWTSNYVWLLLVTILSGIGNVLASIIFVSWFQTTVPPALRARVLAVRRIGLGAAGALGTLLAGWTAAAFGAVPTLMWLGLSLGLAAFLARTVLPNSSAEPRPIGA
jgi:MFS family permease